MFLLLLLSRRQILRLQANQFFKPHGGLALKTSNLLLATASFFVNSSIQSTCVSVLITQWHSLGIISSKCWMKRSICLLKQISLLEIMAVWLLPLLCSGSWSGNFKDATVVDAHIFQHKCHGLCRDDGTAVFNNKLSYNDVLKWRTKFQNFSKQTSRRKLPAIHMQLVARQIKKERCQQHRTTQRHPLKQATLFHT